MKVAMAVSPFQSSSPLGGMISPFLFPCLILKEGPSASEAFSGFVPDLDACRLGNASSGLPVFYYNIIRDFIA